MAGKETPFLILSLVFVLDSRHVSVYGNIYAVVDVCCNLPFAFVPVLAGTLVDTLGFTQGKVVIAVFNLGYVPVLYFLRNICARSFRDEFQVMKNLQENGKIAIDTGLNYIGGSVIMVGCCVN